MRIFYVSKEFSPRQPRSPGGPGPRLQPLLLTSSLMPAPAPPPGPITVNPPRPYLALTPRLPRHNNLRTLTRSRARAVAADFFP